MSQKKDTTPPFRLNFGNAAARQVDPEDPRLARLIAEAEESAVPSAAPPAVPSAAAPETQPPEPKPAAAARRPPERAAPRLATPSPTPSPTPSRGLTVEPAAAAPAPRRTRRALAPTVRITVAVDGPLPWEVLGELADAQRNMNLRLTEADLQKLQWLAQCLPGTSIQKICREAIRDYVDARIADLLGR